MQQSEANEELRAIFQARVRDSFATAHRCLTYARIAHQRGDHASLRKWIWSTRVLRTAAARRRLRAQRVAPAVVCLLLCLGCGKPAPREFTVDFDVQPSSDGSVRWTLRFSRNEFHTMVDTAARDDGNINDQVHADVRALIRAGLESHHLIGCRPVEQVVAAKLDDGFAFFGTCPVSTHALPADGI